MLYSAAAVGDETGRAKTMQRKVPSFNNLGHNMRDRERKRDRYRERSGERGGGRRESKTLYYCILVPCGTTIGAGLRESKNERTGKQKGGVGGSSQGQFYTQYDHGHNSLNQAPTLTQKDKKDKLQYCSNWCRVCLVAMKKSYKWL